MSRDCINFMPNDSHNKNQKKNHPEKPLFQDIINGNYTAVERALNLTTESLQTFVEFLKPVKPLIIGGFIVGVICAAGGDYLGKLVEYKTIWDSFLAFLFLAIKEIGIGLLVASVAVFGYEYSQHVRGDFERQQKQEGALRSLDAATAILQDVDLTKASLEKIKNDFILIRSEDVVKAREKILNLSLDNSEDEERFKNLIIKLIKNAQSLKKTDTIFSESYLRFIVWLSENIVLLNATQLSRLEQYSDTPLEATSWAFSLPSTKFVAGQMLGFQLNSLQQGDSYQTISNVLLWDGRDFDFFWSATEEACKRGVIIERLFNLCNLIDDEILLKATFHKAKNIINKHKQLEKVSNGKYTVRFFCKKQAEKILSTYKHLPSGIVDSDFDIPAMHKTNFGIFTHVTDRKNDVVAFRVKDTQLSRMSISRKVDDVERCITRFQMMWAISGQVPDPFDGGIEYFKNIVEQNY